MKRFFPVDIFAVKDFGIERWQDEFFWPVADKDFVGLCNGIDSYLRDKINSQPGDIGDILLIWSLLRFEYWHFFHALKVVDEVNKRKGKILCSEKTFWYRDILSGGRIEMRNLNKTGLTEYGIIERLKDGYAKFLRTIRYNNVSRLTGKGNKITVYGPFMPITKSYIKSLHCTIKFSSRRDWLPGDLSCDMPRARRGKIETVSGEIVSALKDIARINQIGLSGNHIAYLEELTFSTLCEASRMLSLARRRIPKKIGLQLLVPGFGDLFSRSLYVVLRKAGGRVTSFTHGGHIGLYETPTHAFNDFSLADKFVTYTRNNIEFFERIKKSHPPLRGNSVDIITCNSDEFSDLYTGFRKRPLPKTVKKVMLVGYPFNQWRKYHTAGGFSLMHLDLELRIVDILKGAGYEVVYKAHPEKEREVEGLFDNKAAVLTEDNFAECLNTVDAVIFGTTRTTAFSTALCSNRPIIAFEFEEHYKPFKEPMGLLKRRCDFISAAFDERNRIVFDKSRLLDLLSRKPKEPNDDFLKRYFFPDGR